MPVFPSEDVIVFILDIKAKLMLDKVNNLYIVPRKDRKNQDCMVELGLRHNDVADILTRLDVQNYSETVEDLDNLGNWLWIFGFVYFDTELYIKIAMRKRVVCVSFHEKEFDINYPYT